MPHIARRLAHHLARKNSELNEATRPGYQPIIFRLREERPFWRLWEFIGVGAGRIATNAHHDHIVSLPTWLIIPSLLGFTYCHSWRTFLHSRQMNCNASDPVWLPPILEHVSETVQRSPNRTLSDPALCTALDGSSEGVHSYTVDWCPIAYRRHLIRCIQMWYKLQFRYGNVNLLST
jgi:hypothetical protein